MEKGRFRRFIGDMRRTPLAWVPGKGLETGEVMRWSQRYNGTVTVKEMFCRISPTVAILISNSQIAISIMIL